MPDYDFIKLCKETVLNYFNENVDKTDNKKIYLDDVFIVLKCLTRPNNKYII